MPDTIPGFWGYSSEQNRLRSYSREVYLLKVEGIQ